jgi:hypothetical protein
LPAERQSVGPRPAELGFRRGYLIGIASTTTVLVTAALVLVFGYVLPDLGPPATSTPKEDPNRKVASLKLPDASGVITGSAVSAEDRPGASATVNPAVEAAQALMSTGRVQAARRRLLAMAPEASPHVAWRIASSKMLPEN